MRLDVLSNSSLYYSFGVSKGTQQETRKTAFHLVVFSIYAQYTPVLSLPVFADVLLYVGPMLYVLS